MKKIGVFFDDPKFDDYPFTIPLYRTVYRQLADVIRGKGGQLCIVRGNDTYLGGNAFSHGWADDGKEFAHVDGPLKVDLIWNKCNFKGDEGCAVLNDPELDDICTDKWKCYQMFPYLHAKTVIVRSASDMDAALRDIPTTLITAKPLALEGGEGVVVGTPEEIKKAVTTFPYLLQAFVDTSGGVPGLCTERHDFRLLTMNGEVGVCYIRTAPTGDYLANISRGGRVIDVAPDKIPPETLDVFSEIDAVFSRFGNRLYTIDLGRDADGSWKVFELNSKPGFMPMETGPTFKPFYDHLADFLLAACR